MAMECTFHWVSLPTKITPRTHLQLIREAVMGPRMKSKALHGSVTSVKIKQRDSATVAAKDDTSAHFSFTKTHQKPAGQRPLRTRVEDPDLHWRWQWDGLALFRWFRMNWWNHKFCSFARKSWSSHQFGILDTRTPASCSRTIILAGPESN